MDEQELEAEDDQNKFSFRPTRYEESIEEREVDPLIMGGDQRATIVTEYDPYHAGLSGTL